MTLTIALCTRNRFADLKRCLVSISEQKEIKKESIEILIIDDGELSVDEINTLENIVFKYQFSYYKKKKAGLFLSRLKTVERSKNEIILFLDDDVVLDENYLSLLLKTYEDFPKAAGVGGVDMLLPKYGFLRKLYSRIFLYHSGNKSKLSLSMMNSSMYLWQDEKEPFLSEFLDGCNMSFKKSALKDVEFQDYFNHYSLGEDLFFSLYALKRGNLMVNPSLKVKHIKSPLSRDRAENVAFMKVVNHYKLLKYSNNKNYKYITIWWTYTGYLFASFCKMDFKELKGYMKGMKYLVFEKI